MMSHDNDSDLKIVDFSLSKIIGPNESSLDPYGTLFNVATEWSLGVISYLLLIKVLPFDDEVDKEITR
jgi:hypothetical protein